MRCVSHIFSFKFLLRDRAESNQLAGLPKGVSLKCDE
jgi:hypothetical protein